jgi:hypothetical protein
MVLCRVATQQDHRNSRLGQGYPADVSAYADALKPKGTLKHLTRATIQGASSPRAKHSHAGPSSHAASQSKLARPPLDGDFP